MSTVAIVTRPPGPRFGELFSALLAGRGGVSETLSMGAAFLCLFLLATSGRDDEVTRAGRWEVRSSFWMSLHQTLMRDASARSARDASALTPGQRAAWDGAVNVYRKNAGRGSITFAEAMRNLQNQLVRVGGDATNPRIEGPLAEAIAQAAPVYRLHWWSADHSTNRFLAGYLAAMLRDGGEEIVRMHETVYGERFPEKIRIDITPFAEPFGAYSHPLDNGFVITIASRDAGNHGLNALEIALHESSHSIVSPWNGRVSRALRDAAAKFGIEPPRDLWHAILFATTSELTERALARRGVTQYTPMAEDLLTRAWPKYREPIEKHWHPYLRGTGTLEEAVEKMVAAVR